MVQKHHYPTLFSLLCALCISAVSFAQTPAPVVTSVELTTFTTDDPTAVALPQTRVPVMTVRGTNFFPSSPGPLVTIRRAGFPDMQRIAGNINGGDASNGWIEVRNVDLSAYPPGSFDVVVTRAPSNAGSHTLANAFSLLPHGPDRLESRGAWGGPINQLHVEGNRLYLGAGRRLVILDATDESNLVELGAIDLKATVLDFEIRNGYALVATHGDEMNQFCIVDVQNPTGMEIVWNSRHITIPCCYPHVVSPKGIEIDGDTAYILSADSLLLRFDITDPASPQYLGTVWPHSSSLRHIIIENGLLYGVRSSFNSEVRIFDLTTSGPPPQIGTIPLPVSEVGRGKLWQVEGGRILCTRSEYVADDSVGFDEGAMVFDASALADPAEVLSIQAPIPNFGGRRWIGAAMAPGLLLVAEAEPEVDPRDIARGLLIYDTTVTPPVLRSTFKTGGSVYGVKAIGDRAYLFDWGEGLVVLDISNPDHPLRLGSYHSPASLRNMAKQGDLLYVSDAWTGFTILNVADPSRPQVVGIYRTPTGPNTQGSAGLVLRDGLVYLAAGYGGLDIVDVTDPSAPIRVGNIPALPTGTAIHGVELDGHILRIGRFVPNACGSGPGLYLRNLDASDPLHPSFLGEVFVICGDTAKIQTIGGITRIRKGSATDSASDFHAGELVTIDCTNPAAPFVVAVSGSHQRVADFTLAGPLLYTCADIDPTAQRDSALVISDAASPTPAPLGVFNAREGDDYWAVAAHAGDVYAIAEVMLLLDGTVAGLQLFKPTTNPASLRLAASLGRESVGGQLHTELFADSGWVYATRGDGDALLDQDAPAYWANGLVIVEHITPPPPCPGDANGDNLVNAADLSVLLGSFGGSVPPGTGADFNGDGIVNAADLSVLLATFGSSCP